MHVLLNQLRHIKLLGLLAIFGATPPPTWAEAPEQAESSLTPIRARYSGARALDTTAFVEQFWRVPGNTGFNESIFRVESILKAAGYVDQDSAGPDTRLTYRIERRPMGRPTWEPVNAAIFIEGEDQPLMESATNRNMPVMYSFSTPEGGVAGQIVHVTPDSIDDLKGDDALTGKIAFAEASPLWVYRECIQKRGAMGMLCYSIPGFNQPRTHPNSVSFMRMPHDPAREPWGVMLSTSARDRIVAALDRPDDAPLRMQVKMQTKIYESEELTIIAQVRGDVAPDQEFVYSAHVQEPGANDNASGVGCLAEMARVAAEMLRAGEIDPARTMTFLWGDEIRSTRRYVTEDEHRAANIRWGMSLDMVGEDTAKTGGTFLIEKMPDPSAVWPRGDEHFSEWGGRPISVDRLTPHYFNDLVLNRCLEEASDTGWVVKTNPFEGGSDHVPFLRAGKPGLLLWHFTDVYYHTDGDRIDMVSAETLRHVGVSALACGLMLTRGDTEQTAARIIDETQRAALSRLEREFKLSRDAIASGEDVEEQLLIVETWMKWYIDALRAVTDVAIDAPADSTSRAIDRAIARVEAQGMDHLNHLRPRLDE